MTLIVTRTTFNQILIKEYIFTLYTEIGLAELNLLDSTVSQPHVIFSRNRFSLPAHISILPARFHSIHLPYRTPGYPVSQRCPNLHLQHISHWSSPFQPCILSHSPLHYLLSSLVPLCFLEGKWEKTSSGPRDRSLTALALSSSWFCQSEGIFQGCH